MLRTPLQSKLLAEIPGLHHGFTSKDMPKSERVAIDEKTATAKQIHTDRIHWVTQLEKGLQEADAVGTLTPNLPVGVYSADCVPVLLAALDTKTNRVYAALAVHGGWRSTALGIAGKALTELAAKTAKRPTRLLAAIGPCIGFDHFEVHEDVLHAFPHALSCGLARPLAPDREGRPKFALNLPGENARQLREAAQKAGLEFELDDLALCTVREAERFPSHRRRDRDPMSGILSFLAFD